MVEFLEQPLLEDSVVREVVTAGFGSACVDPQELAEALLVRQVSGTGGDLELAEALRGVQGRTLPLGVDLVRSLRTRTWPLGDARVELFDGVEWIVGEEQVTELRKLVEELVEEGAPVRQTPLMLSCRLFEASSQRGPAVDGLLRIAALGDRAGRAAERARTSLKKVALGESEHLGRVAAGGGSEGFEALLALAVAGRGSGAELTSVAAEESVATRCRAISAILALWPKSSANARVVTDFLVDALPGASERDVLELRTLAVRTAEWVEPEFATLFATQSMRVGRQHPGGDDVRRQLATASVASLSVESWSAVSVAVGLMKDEFLEAALAAVKNNLQTCRSDAGCYERGLRGGVWGAIEQLHAIRTLGALKGVAGRQALARCVVNCTGTNRDVAAATLERVLGSSGALPAEISAHCAERGIRGGFDRVCDVVVRRMAERR